MSISTGKDRGADRRIGIGGRIGIPYRNSLIPKHSRTQSFEVRAECLLRYSPDTDQNSSRILKDQVTVVEELGRNELR